MQLFLVVSFVLLQLPADVQEFCDVMPEMLQLPVAAVQVFLLV
jgi:hypothetical protein